MYMLEDFHPAIDEVRAHALNQTFIDWTGYDEQVYKRVCITEVPLLHQILEDLFGEITMLGMGYRLNYAGEVPNQAIHSDLGWGTHALVLYLSEGPSGTAFWKHLPTGTERIDVGNVELFKQVTEDWDKEDKWVTTHCIPMKYNRAIIYESALYHSRFPFEAFGDSPENGRLIAVAFFTPKGEI